MFGRMLQPVAGSSVSSWNVALMCFQLILLGGYMYTHYLPKWIGLKTYLKVHMGLLVISVICSFLFFRVSSFAVDTNAPAVDVVLILFSTIGVPFFVVSTSSTNFQRWYDLYLKESPYHLYSLSNFGNLAALIGYGIVVEVLFGLRNQILLWNVLYSIAVAFSIAIAFRVYRSLDEAVLVKQSEPAADELSGVGSETAPDEDPGQSGTTNGEGAPVLRSTKIYWTLLAFIPSALMIATNSVLDNVVNVNHIHYFWLLPLIIYLMAYIIAFSRLDLGSIHIYEKLSLWSAVTAVLLLFSGANMAVYAVSMITLFMVSLTCNLYIVKSAPDASNLTEFYMFIAIGGALGGVFASLLAPMIFPNVYEYSLLVFLFLFVLAYQRRLDRKENLALSIPEHGLVFLGVFASLLWGGVSVKTVTVWLVLGILYLFRRLLSYNRTRFLNVGFLLLIVLGSSFFLLKDTGVHVRNFYGIKRVTRGLIIPKDGEPLEMVSLINGNTLHGSQFAKGTPYEFEALAYYDKAGSTVGKFFTEHREEIQNVGIVGLGVGSMSALSEPDQKWTYFEIDPQVIEIARDQKSFTMLAKYQHEVVPGDARITLEEEADGIYDVLVLDAYSGDLIPASLLTREAIELYLDKIKEDGILFFHISNRQYDLRPVLSKAAETLGIPCYHDTDRSEGVLYPVPSEWIMMTRNEALAGDSWVETPKYPDFRLWTDDRYSLTTILK